MFELIVKKKDMKFSCAHFIAYGDFREKIHGHNYNLMIKLVGKNLSSEGYLLDFGVVKRIGRELCKSFNERFICPCDSDVLQILDSNEQIHITCRDGSYFCFPKGDCILLPIVHSSAEELAHYMFCELIRRIGLQYLHERFITSVDVGIIEVEDQEAHFCCDIPDSEESFQRIVDQLKLHRDITPCRSEV